LKESVKLFSSQLSAACSFIVAEMSSYVIFLSFFLEGYSLTWVPLSRATRSSFSSAEKLLESFSSRVPGKLSPVNRT
jgi:hypothetical protein